MLKYALDIDGVLCNFFQGFLKHSKKLGLRDYFAKTYRSARTWSDPKEQFDIVYNSFLQEREKWENLNTLNCVQQMFHSSTHLIWDGMPEREHHWAEKTMLPDPEFYLTGRMVPQEWTEQWIKNVELPDVPVITVQHCKDYYAADPKLEILQKNKIDYYVDDLPSTVITLNNNGINCLLFDQPHNRDVDLPRIKQLYELKPYLEGEVTIEWQK